MKKLLSSVLLALLLTCGAIHCYATEVEPHLILRKTDFNEHVVGEKPTAFDWVWHDSVEDELLQIPAGRDNTEIVKIEKDGNSENLAAKFNSFVDTENNVTGFARLLFNFYPIKESGVISFSFRVDDLSTKKVSFLNTNVTESRHVSYTDNNNYFQFITVDGGNVYYNGSTLIKSNISVGTWYRIDFLADLTSQNAKLYFNGVSHNVPLPSGTVNISEIKFNLPTEEGGAWYVDDIRIYEANSLVDDTQIDAEWNQFKNSSFYIGYDFEAGRAANYDYFAFLKCNGRKFSVIGTDKFYTDNQTTKLPVKIYRFEDEVMVPVRAIAESFGADVEWNDSNGRVVVNYAGRTMEVAPGENVYYIDGKPAKLHYAVSLVEGNACMHIDVLFNFLNQKYYEEDNILWFGEQKEFDWHMPLDGNGDELWGTRNLSLQENIYNRILWTLLCDVPTNETIDSLIKTHSADNAHPRLELTNESIAMIKAGIDKDEKLAKVVNSINENADKYVSAELLVHETSDGKRASYTDPGKTYLTDMSFAYALADSEDEKTKYKNGIWRQLEALNEFPDFHFQDNNALGTGTLAYGLAYAYDWVDWNDSEKTIIQEMSKRNIFDYALMAYNSSVRDHGRDIAFGVGNQSVITNGGITMLALAMYESDPDYFARVLKGSIRAMEGGIIGAYFPNGEYPEGLSYWRYAADFMPRVLKSMQTSLGTDFGYTDVPGVLETATFPIVMRGATTGYGFGDAAAENPIVPLFMFSASQTGNKELAQYRKDEMGNSGTTIDVVNWVFDTDEYTAGLDSYDDDMYSEGNTTVIMRTGWDLSDTTVAFHGGANNDGHGHFDSGSVQFDMDGIRFGMDLPKENYTLRESGAYNNADSAKNYPDGYYFLSNHYYRGKGEGHNIVVANRKEANTKEPTDPKSYDVNPEGTTEFFEMEFGENVSYALLNMTDTNDIFDCAIRGVKLDKINKRIEIQDDITASEETDFMWSMHTEADIEISDDGKTAILTHSNIKIKATIINDCDLRFEVLPAAFDETYGTANKPLIETPNTVYGKDDAFYLEHGVACEIKKDIQKLAVRTDMADSFKLSVVFEPYIEGSAAKAEYVPYPLWENTGTKRQYLASVLVDGEPLENFNPEKYSYTIDVVSQEVEPPVIAATAMNEFVEVEVLQAESVPGAATVVLVENGQTAGLYSFIISPLNDTTKFHSDKQLLVYDYTVTSEPQPQNAAKNLFDGDFSTVFATNEQGGNVVIDLGSVIEGNLKLNMSCLQGDSRKENFKIEYSEDGKAWSEAYNGTNSGTTKELEQYDIAQRARFVKVSFYGNSKSLWASISEMFVSNE